jgi:hypothetical protein
MASVASQLIEEVTAHAQGDRLDDAREICAEDTHFHDDLRTLHNTIERTAIFRCDCFSSVQSYYQFLLLRSINNLKPIKTKVSSCGSKIQTL